MTRGGLVGLNPADGAGGRVVVYGRPEQVAVYIESMTRLLAREPNEVFAHPAVCDASDQFSKLIERRRDEAEADNDGTWP